MYLPNMDEPEELNYMDDYSNFLPSFTTEESFGDKIKSDLEAIQGAGEQKKLSKLAKGGIAILGVGIISFVAYKLIKRKK